MDKRQYKTQTKAQKRRIKYAYFRAMMVIITVLVFLTLALLLLPRPSVSELENRDLTAFPEFSWESYVDGSFTRNLTLWFTDTVPFRDELVELSGRMKEYEGVRDDNVKFHGNVEIVATETEPPVTLMTAPNQSVTETPGAPAIPGNEAVAAPPAVPAVSAAPAEEDATLEFDNNGIVTVGDRSYMLFGGNKTQGKYYADVLSAYKTALGDNVNVYNMVVPTAVEFYLPSRYAEYSNPEKDQIDYIYENLVGVTPVDAYSALAAHTNEDIYLKTDHHWSQLGAYYASTAFAEALGETPQPITDYEERKREGFVGSLYGYTNDIKIKESPETFTYYVQPLPYDTTFYKYDTLTSMGGGQLYYEAAALDNSYGMFLGADALHTKVVTENTNGKKLCVFKESFGNALIPTLVPYFSEIYVIDIRFFGMNAIDYMKAKGITDVLFVNNIFAANTNSLISNIDALRFGPVGLTQKKTESETAISENAPVSEPVTAEPYADPQPDPFDAPLTAPQADPQVPDQSVDPMLNPPQTAVPDEFYPNGFE
jgi:hypothetical protein